jgi:two-component system, chemotaxis family, protein-glutamate methylesterase/glutaminase
MNITTEAAMEKRNIIVRGASAGGFEALQKLVAALPPKIDAAILVVWHLAPDSIGILPSIFNKLNTIPAAHAINAEPLCYNRIYVAPPDHHLLLEKDWIRITHGPKENRFRPAVDPLFRSAALAYGERVIGVVLSGALDDGAAGLWTIKQYGGLAVVQDPNDAVVPSMPEHAIQAVAVDYTVPIANMAQLLMELCNQQIETNNNRLMKKDERTEAEVRIALQDGVTGQEMLHLGELSPYTCPECHGVLVKLTEGSRIRFRCHTGHAFSSDSLLAAVTESIEENLWSVIRNVEESVLLLNHMGDHFAETNQPKLAAKYFKKAKDAEGRMEQVRQIVLQHEQLSEDTITDEPE